MAIKVKASTWKNITGAYVKRTTWSPVKQIYVKVVNTWKSVFLSDPPVIVSKPSFRLLSYSGAAATSPQFLDQSLYGKDGSYTNYTGITGRKITYSDTSDGLVRNTIISGDLFTTGAGITTSDRLTVDGKYLFYELTVSNGTDVLDSIEAVSDPMLMIKKQPALGSFTTALTGQSSPNSVLTFNYSLENYYYNKIVPATSKIRWWRSSNTTASGVIVKEETISATTTSSDSSSLIGTSTYTVAASSDNNSYIVVEIIGVSSWTTNNGYGGSFPDYQIASYSSGVIQAPYQFSFGNTLYVGSNGYIGLQNGGNAAGLSGSGRNINIWNEDLVQYRLQEYSDSSNYHLYFRSYRYQNPLVQSAINALDYQIKFYTAQPYCDVYLFRKGSSVPTYLDSPGYYKNFVDDLTSGNTAGVSGPFFWGAGAVMRIYFNEVTPATTTGISWTSISDTLWKDITTSNIDDSFTTVVTSANQQAPGPTTPTALSATNNSGAIRLTFSGGSGDQYDIYYNNSGTRPTDGQAFTDYPNVTSPYDPPLTSTGITRWFWVRKSTGSTRSNWYPSDSSVSIRLPLFAPPTPVITNSAQSSTSLSWHWTQPTPSESQDEPTSWDYNISTSTTTPSSWTNITTRPTSGSPLVTGNLIASTTYYLHVRAKNADNSTTTYQSGTTSATPVASPSAPTGLSVSRTVGSDFLSTALNPSASGYSTKVQTWSFGRNTTFTINFTRGANATSSEMYYSTSSSTPSASTSQNGGTNANASGSFPYVGAASTTSGNDYAVYFWVRSTTATENSAWTYAGTQNVDTPAYTAFSIVLYRTSVGNANSTTATPSRNDLTNTWTSVNTSFSHQAQVRLTFDGIARTANS